MRKKIVFALLGVAIVQHLSAQDSLKIHVLNEAVVTGTKFEVPVEKSGKVIFKIDANRLKTGQQLTEILNEIPGVQMDGIFGTPGTNVSYFIRGGRSKNSLILMDGVPMNDPTGIDPFFDLRFLTADQINQVEVLQGGLSSLYGSGASASVINIQTKNAVEGVHGALGLQGGSWNTFSQNLNVNGQQGKFSFLLSANNLKSDGFSAAFDSLETNTYDDDGFERRNGFIKLGYQFTHALRIDLLGGIDWFDSQYDNDAFTDGNNTLEQEQTRFAIKASWNYSKGYVNLTIQQTAVNRDVQGSFPAQYNGDNFFGEIINKHEVNSVVTLLSGVNFQRQNYDEKGVISKDTTSFTIVDPYASILVAFPNGLNIHAGARLNNHSEYGSKLIYNFNPSWLLNLSEDLKIKPFGSISASYITPTLFQLHTPYGGNVNLDPENSLNIEYGLSLFVSNKFTITAANYFRKEQDVIGYGPSFSYENIAEKRNVKGVTVDLQYAPSPLISFSGDFSWVTSDHKNSFYRIPERKAGLGVNIKPMKGTFVSVHYQFTGKRTDLYFDQFFVPHDVELEKYSLLDLSISQSLINDHLFLYGSVYNLTDEDFIGVYGYTTRERNFSLGIRYNF